MELGMIYFKDNYEVKSNTAKIEQSNDKRILNISLITDQRQ